MNKILPSKRRVAEPHHPAPWEDELLATRREVNRVSKDFLKVDVATALTFAGLALQAENGIRKRRNQRAARRAYDTICKLAQGVELTGNDARDLADNLGRLKSELQRLGEVF